MVGFSLAFHVFPMEYSLSSLLPHLGAQTAFERQVGSIPGILTGKAKTQAQTTMIEIFQHLAHKLRILPVSYVYMTYTQIRQGKSCTHHHRIITLKKSAKGHGRAEGERKWIVPASDRSRKTSSGYAAAAASIAKKASIGRHFMSIPFRRQRGYQMLPDGPG